MKRDYYEVLGVDRNADGSDIKSAYRKKAVRYHPDKNKGDKGSEEKFKEAAEAYSVLSDGEKRARYDRFGHQGMGQGGFGNIDPDIFSDFGDIFGGFVDIFGDFFGGGRSRGSRATRGNDLRYELRISFEEAAFGVKTKLKIPRQANCQVCNGSGADPRHGPTTCSTCSGRGQVAYQQGFFTISRTCSRCQGSGVTIQHPCHQCRGSGRRQEEKLLELKMPPGVDEGARLRISGEGEAGLNGGPPGNLYVDISIEPHPFFKRRDRDVLCEIPLSFSQAALGGEVVVKTLEGEERIKIPPATQTGATFRLKHRGVASLNGRGRGDQLVTATVVTPTKLTSEQQEIFEHLADVAGEEHHAGTFFEKFREFFR